ncbi:MAG: hypothetical protein ACO398_09855, partial [Kiritimatiellia bacterium]
LRGSPLSMGSSGTVRFWMRPGMFPASGPALLFSSGGTPSRELWWTADEGGTLWARFTENGRQALQRFQGGLVQGIWQQLVFSYDQRIRAPGRCGSMIRRGKPWRAQPRSRRRARGC